MTTGLFLGTGMFSNRLAGSDWDVWLRWLSLCLWLGVIYFGSSQQGVSAVPSYWLDWVIKKSLHLIEYGLLGILLWRVLQVYLADRAGRWWAWMLVLMFASSDEIHQLWVPSRTGRWFDVMIDLTGAGLALCCWPWLLRQLKSCVKLR